MAMTAERATGRAIDQICGYADDGLGWEEFGRAVIDVVGRIVPNDAAVLATVDPMSGLFTSLVRDGIDDSQDELFAQIELTQPDPITLTNLARAPGGVGILADHVDGDPMSNARCRELLDPHFGLQHELRGVVRLGGRMWAALALYRPRSRRGFDTGDASSLSAIESAIARGVQRCLATEAKRPPADDDGVAVVLVDCHGAVLQVTATAVERLGDLGWRSGEILPTSVRHTAAAARAATASTAPALVRVRSRSGSWMVVRASPFPGHDDAVAVTIEFAGSSYAIDIAADLYGLTQRQVDVVRGVVAGLSTIEIARSLGIAEYTVQDHLKAVFRKLDVVSRRELIPLFAS